MPLLNIFFNQNKRGEIGGISIDATISDEHTSACDLTENPVEEGANVTDHVQLKPVELTIEGVISDTPLDFGILNNLITGNFGAIKDTAKGIAGNFTGQTTRSTEEYNKLLDLQRKREPFKVVTGLKVYENMILVKLSVNRNATTGKSIHFKADLKQIRIVSSKTAKSMNVAKGAKKLASKTKSVGQKITEKLDPVKDSKVEKGSSKLFGRIKNGF